MKIPVVSCNLEQLMHLIREESMIGFNAKFNTCFWLTLRIFEHII